MFHRAINILSQCLIILDLTRGDFGSKGPWKLRKPFQQVQHNCNNYLSNTLCHWRKSFQMLVGRRGLEPRTTWLKVRLQR